MVVYRVLVWASPLCVVAIGLCLQPKAARTETELIDRMHAYYQSQFDNLEMVKSGLFGTARIETSKIKGHLRQGGDPGYDPPGFTTYVSIFGNHGSRIDPSTISNRYHRLQGPERVRIQERPDPKKVEELLAKAAEAASKGKKSALSVRSNGWRIEIRPIVLSKPECLKCHAPLKQRDAVALAMYSVHAYPQASKR